MLPLVGAGAAWFLAVEIDRRRERRLRPSVLVDVLGKAQQAGPRFKPAPFLASLAAAHDLVVAKQDKSGGTVVKLVDVYGVRALATRASPATTACMSSPATSIYST
ncbi:MAG: hypothetical protein WKF51_13200 [Geodermatophilaceae bacterium]